MKLFRFIFVHILLFSTSIVFSQELLTLDDALSLAMKNNQNIIIARNNAVISKNNVNIGNADLLPRIDLSAGATYSDNTATTDAGDIRDKTTLTSAQISAAYTLFDGFGNIYRFRKLKAAGELGELQARNSIEQTIVQVSNAYFAVANVYESFRIVNETVKISKERLDRAKNRADYGQANKIEVLSAQVDLNADSVSYVNTKLFLDETKRNLNVLLNRDVDTDFLVDSEVTFGGKLSLDELNKNAFENNASYRIALNNLKLSKYDIKIANSNFYPSLALNSSYSFSRYEDNFDVTLDKPNKGLTAGVILSFNLFNGFKNSIQRQNAVVSYNNQVLTKELIHNHLVKEVKNTFEAYNNSRYVLKIEKRNLESAELNFQRTRDLYNLGQVTTTQFREAQLNLIRAKNNISIARYEAKLYEINLAQLSGTLVQTLE